MKNLPERIYCYQITYMNDEIHEYTLVKWTDLYVKFKWKIDGIWHMGTQYHESADYKWFKTESEATEFLTSRRK